jgi:hypothetical protein
MPFLAPGGCACDYGSITADDGAIATFAKRSDLCVPMQLQKSARFASVATVAYSTVPAAYLNYKRPRHTYSQHPN